jgi:hypothetical protein
MNLLTTGLTGHTGLSGFLRVENEKKTFKAQEALYLGERVTVYHIVDRTATTLVSKEEHRLQLEKHGKGMKAEQI